MKEILSANSEQTEEHIEKQDKVLHSLDNKKKMVLDFIGKGEKLMQVGIFSFIQFLRLYMNVTIRIRDFYMDI